MVEKLYLAVKKKQILYFWHQDNNLIEGVKPTILALYETKLKEVLDAIDANDVEKVVKFLLTTDEMTKFKSSDFYIRVSAANLVKSTSVQSENNGQKIVRMISCDSSGSGSVSEGVRALNDELDSIRINSSGDKISQFENRLTDLEDRVKRLEMAMRKITLNKELVDVFNGISLDINVLMIKIRMSLLYL